MRLWYWTPPKFQGLSPHGGPKSFERFPNVNTYCNVAHDRVTLGNFHKNSMRFFVFNFQSHWSQQIDPASITENILGVLYMYNAVVMWILSLRYVIYFYLFRYRSLPWRFETVYTKTRVFLSILILAHLQICCYKMNKRFIFGRKHKSASDAVQTCRFLLLVIII